MWEPDRIREADSDTFRRIDEYARTEDRITESRGVRLHDICNVRAPNASAIILQDV